jgi:integrase
MGLIFEIGFDKILSGYKFPDRMRRELTALLKGNLSKVLSTTRASLTKTSIKTQERRLYSIFGAIREVRGLGYKIESPYSLAEKHIEAVVKHWVADGQTTGTMENKLAHLKAFAGWMGKYQLVKSLHDYVSAEDLGGKREYVTTTDKSWEAHGINAQGKIAEIALTEPHVAIQLKLQAAFGLRIEESFAMPIAKTIREMLRNGGDRIAIEKGTKGGRRRTAPMQLRYAVLEEALQYANTRTGSTTPSQHTIPSWRDYYNKVMRKHGIYKKGLGITSHGLRHQWLQELYKSLTQFDAPIKGGDEHPDIETHREALKLAVEAAGHSKPSKSGMYLSTTAAMNKLRAPDVAIGDVRRALEESGGDKKAAAHALGISRQRVYRLLVAVGDHPMPKRK